MNLFENPKVTLGFAGVVIAAGLVASIALNEFVPSANDASVEEVAEEAEQGTTSRSADLASDAMDPADWSDEGLSDDWGSGSIGFALNPGDVGATPPETEDLGFGDYSPEQPGAATSRGSRNAPGQTRNGVRITSRAAPGAPPPRPPGSSDTEPVEVQLTE